MSHKNLSPVNPTRPKRIAGTLAKGTHVMPWRIEDELKAVGANYMRAELFKGSAVRDGNLVTGQQNFSGGFSSVVVSIGT